MGQIRTTSKTVILVTLNDVKEDLQLWEVLKHSKKERRSTNVPCLKNVGPTGLDLQR